MPLVGKNWHQKVNDPVRDVFVVYVSQYCMKCKQMERAWEQLASETPNDLIVATIDLEKNDIEGRERTKQQLPILTFYPKENKAGIDYEGERALDAWLEWLEEHSTTYQAHLKLIQKEQEK